MAGVAAGGVIALLITGHSRWAGGFAAGSAVSLLGYRWMQSAVELALAQSEIRPARATAAKLVIRFPLMLGILILLHWTGWLPLGPVVTGLFVPVAGVIAEILYLLASGAARGPSAPGVEIAPPMDAAPNGQPQT